MEFSRYPVTSDSLGIVADWTYALNENGELSEVLDRIMRLVKSNAAFIIRRSKVDNKARYIARCDMQTGKIWPTQPQSYVEAIVGEFINSAKPGSIWRLSEATALNLNDVTDITADDSHQLIEAIVSPMESTHGHVDYIELHFKRKPAEHDLNLLIMLIGTFSAGWGRRAPASISKKLNQKQKLLLITANGGLQFSILDSENPAKLSRCEFRVCSLLGDGMSVNAIASTLSVSARTVRSQLSSIFSKTGASNQVELLCQLNEKPITSSGDASVRGLRFS